MSTASQGLPTGPRKPWGWGRKIAIGVGGFIVFGVAIFLVVLRLTSPLTEVADGFFADLRDGAVEKAYARASGPFRSATDISAFRSFVKDQHLDAITSTSWGARKIAGMGDGATGELEGTATSRDGSVRSLKLTFVKEEGLWRIQYLNLGAVGADAGPASGKIPEERELVRMTHDIIMAFARSVNAGSMQEFHGVISERWAGQQDVAALDQAFKSFIDGHINLSGLQNMTPVFDTTPAIDAKGWLRYAGHYASTPSRVTFEMGYIEEGIGWKLGSFKINVKPVDNSQQ